LTISMFSFSIAKYNAAFPFPFLTLNLLRSLSSKDSSNISTVALSSFSFVVVLSSSVIVSALSLPVAFISIYSTKRLHNK